MPWVTLAVGAAVGYALERSRVFAYIWQALNTLPAAEHKVSVEYGTPKTEWLPLRHRNRDVSNAICNICAC
jgi:hypothetical protein